MPSLDQVMEKYGGERVKSVDEVVGQYGGERVEGPQYGGPVEEAFGLGETALQMASGAALEPVAGWAGIVAEALPGGMEGPEAVEAVRSISYQPKSEIGKRTSEAVAKPFMWLDDKIDRIAEKAGMGNPMAQTAIKTSLYALPGIKSINRAREVAPGVAVTRAMAKKAKREVERAADDLGVDMGSWDMPDQMVGAADRLAPPGKGSAIEDLQPEVMARAEQARSAASAKFEEAKALGGKTQASHLDGFYDRVAQELVDDDIAMMPSVRQRLSELENLKDPQGKSWIGEDGTVDINQLERFRKRLNKRVTDPSEGVALGKIKRLVDKKMDEIFTEDMMSGSPEAIAKWRDAREAWKNYKDRFFKKGAGANKVIRDLVEREANVEEVRNWIFGASAVGGKKVSSSVVKKLKDILGEDSPQITALRSEVLYDVLEPLLQQKPNFNAFVRNYDKIVKNNQSLIRELAPFAETNLKKLRDIAAASDKVGRRDGWTVDVNSLIARSGPWAHGIAKAGMRQQVARNLISFIRNTEKGAKKELVREMLGYDPDMAFISPQSMAYTAIIGEQISNE